MPRMSRREGLFPLFQKLDDGAQIGVPGSVSNGDSSSTPHSVSQSIQYTHAHTSHSEGHLYILQFYTHAPITPIDKEVMSARSLSCIRSPLRLGDHPDEKKNRAMTNDALALPL